MHNKMSRLIVGGKRDINWTRTRTHSNLFVKLYARNNDDNEMINFLYEFKKYHNAMMFYYLFS